MILITCSGFRLSRYCDELMSVDLAVHATSGQRSVPEMPVARPCRSSLRSGRDPTAPARRMGRAKRNPSIAPAAKMMGFASALRSRKDRRWDHSTHPTSWSPERRSVGLDVIAAVFAHRALERRPVDAGAAADVGEGLVDAALHALQTADIDVRARIFHQRGDG